MSNASEGSLPKRCFQDFEFRKVFVDITKVRLMSNSVRLVNEKDAEEKYKAPFMEGRYGCSGQHISVAVPGNDMWRKADEVFGVLDGDQDDSFCADSVFGEGEVVVVDGQHRHHVLNLSDVVAKVGTRQPVHLYRRKDEKEMDHLDALFLGNELNYEAGQVRKMSPMDHVYLAMSHVKEFIGGGSRFDDETVRLVSVVLSGRLEDASKAVATLLLRHDVSSYSQTQTRQYATVVYACHRMEGAYGVLKDILSDSVDAEGRISKNTITLNRLTPIALWDGVDSLHQLQFRLKASKIWMEVPRKSRNRAASTTTMTKFVQSVDGLYSFFAKSMAENGKDINEVFKLPMNMSEWETVGDYLTGQCRLWTEIGSSRFVSSRKGILPYIVRNTPDLGDIAEKFTAPKRVTRAARSARTPPPLSDTGSTRRPAQRRKRSRALQRRRHRRHSESTDDESSVERSSAEERQKKRRKRSGGGESDAEAASPSRKAATGSGSSEQESEEAEEDSASALEEREDVEEGDIGVERSVAFPERDEPSGAVGHLEASPMLSFLKEGGPPGDFDFEAVSLPVGDGDGGESKAEDFVQMRIAERVGTVREQKPDQHEDGGVDDRYSDGFRIVPRTGNIVKYRMPDVRCGYYAKACLLHPRSDAIFALEENEGIWVQLFRDDMPSVFPLPTIDLKYLSEAVFNWARHTGDETYPALEVLEDWEKLTSRMPIGDITFSIRKPVVLDPFMWLRSLGVRPPHRSFFTLTGDDLELVHENMFLHAHFAANRTKTVDQFCAGAVEGWYRAKRVELDEAGFVVLEGFADDSVLEEEKNEDVVSAFRLETTLLRRKNTEANRVRKLLEHFEKHIPSPQFISHGRGNKNSVWSTIINEDDGSDGTIVGQARYTTTNFGLTWNLENNKDNSSLVTARAELDIRILQAAKLLRLRYSSFDDPGVSGADSEKANVTHPPPLYAPDTGGRFLATGPKCRPQVPHCDFKWYETQGDSKSVGLKYPGYFCIVTTSSPTPLWVARGSHRYIWQSEGKKKKIEEAMRMEKIIIPPFSMFFARGDVTHAGAGFEDSVDGEGGTYNPLVRYHMYLVREDVPLLDAISYMANLNMRPDK